MKKLISKIAAVGLVAAMAMSLAGCGAGAGSGAGVVKTIDISLTDEQYAFGVDKNNADLLEQTNKYIEQIKSDGTLDSICEHYFGDGEPVGVTSAKEDDSKDQLVVATNAEFSPFEYKEGDTFYGIDMELAQGLAEYLNK